MSAICGRHANTEFFADYGHLFNASIFITATALSTILLRSAKAERSEKKTSLPSEGSFNHRSALAERKMKKPYGIKRIICCQAGSSYSNQNDWLYQRYKQMWHFAWIEVNYVINLIAFYRYILSWKCNGEIFNVLIVSCLMKNGM